MITTTTDGLGDEVFMKLDNNLTVRVKINQNNILKSGINSPELEISLKVIGKLRLNVYPQCCPGYVGVFLRNSNDFDITASLHLKVLKV